MVMNPWIPSRKEGAEVDENHEIDGTHMHWTDIWCRLVHLGFFWGPICKFPLLILIAYKIIYHELSAHMSFSEIIPGFLNPLLAKVTVESTQLFSLTSSPQSFPGHWAETSRRIRLQIFLIKSYNFHRKLFAVHIWIRAIQWLLI